MRAIRLFSVVMIAVMALSLLAACGGDENITVQQPTKTELLTAKTWIPGRVSVIANGTAESTAKYSNFSLKFTADAANPLKGTYTVVSGNEAFVQANGTWELKNNSTVLLRGDGIEMNLTALEANKLNFAFTIQGSISGGRTMVTPTRQFSFELVAF